MLRVFISIILCCIILGGCRQSVSSQEKFTQVQKEKNMLRTVEDYKPILKSGIDVLTSGDSLDEKLIVDLIPSSQEEALMFFNVDIEGDEAHSSAFRKINNEFVRYSIEYKNHELLYKYLAHSQFVDGYFAENYFDNVQKIINQNPEAFCEQFKANAPERVNRLRSMFDKNCK